MCSLKAEEAVSLGGIESAQAKGRVITNLRCSDAEGGLLGRTLLTLVSNKVCMASSLLPGPWACPEWACLSRTLSLGLCTLLARSFHFTCRDDQNCYET